MSDTPPDRLSADPKSPYYDEALLERGVGVRFKGVEKTNVEEYCVSEKWVRVAILLAGTTRIELLEPLTPDSPLVGFLQKRGPGIHHLAFAVGDCQRTIDSMTAQGAPMLSATPNPGAHDCRIAFVHPRHLGGVLAEFVEDPHS